MRIALLLSRIEQTGVTTHTIDLAKGLRDMGHEICLITGGKIKNATERVDFFYDEFKALGVTIKEFRTPRGNSLKKAYESINSIFKIMSDIREFDPDVIHSQSPYMTFIPWLMRKKFTTTIHILYLKPNLKFKNPTHLIAISQESYEFSKRVFGMKEEDMTLIHHGVSDRYGQPISGLEKNNLRTRLGIDNDKLIIGYAGSVSLRKGCDILVESLKNLSPSSQKKIHFVFLGGVPGSKENKWLEKMVHNAGIGSFFKMVPFEDPKPFYDIFDIFVLPSRMESFPLVILEAMMSGCCPVRSNTEGAFEQIEDGVNGLLFENEDSVQFTKVLERLINDGDLRKTLAETAKEKALKEYTIPVMTENTLKVYDRIRIH